MADSENDDDRLDHLNTRLRDGDSTIAQELDRQFRQRLCELVDKRMNQLFKRRQDPEDVVQSVMKSFYVRAANGDFHFENQQALWSLLKKIALNKLVKRIDADCRAKRDIRRENLMDDMNTLSGVKTSHAQARLLGDVLEQTLAELPSPTPEFFRLTLYGYSFAEVTEIVLRDLPPPYPQILQYRLQGFSEQRIAETIGCGRGEIRYKLARMQQRLAKILGSEL